MRPLPVLEAFGGGPLDGRSIPVSGLEVTATDEFGVYVYRVTCEDDGARFLLLVNFVANQPDHAEAA